MRGGGAHGLRGEGVRGCGAHGRRVMVLEGGQRLGLRLPTVGHRPGASAPAARQARWETVAGGPGARVRCGEMGRVRYGVDSTQLLQSADGLDSGSSF